MNIEKSAGLTDTERLLARLAEQSFLNLWTYPNPYREDGDELCDLLVVFENTIILFFDRHSSILIDGKSDEITLWRRWKRKVIDKQLKSARGAERYLRMGGPLYLGPRQEKPFPLPLFNEGMRVVRIIVAHGASEACKLASAENLSGSLGIAYSDSSECSDAPFSIALDKNDPIHLLDSENLELIFSELDTISDFLDYFQEKERVISELDVLSYCAEEDLLAYYFRNFNKRENRHYIKTNRRKLNPINGLHIDEGFWLNFSNNHSYLRKKEADKISYFWDNLIQKTGQNIMDGTAGGNADVFSGKSAIHEMAKESRFSRRYLSGRFLSAATKFPIPEDKSIHRLITFTESFDGKRGYVLLQLYVHPELQGDYEDEYAPRRRAILEIACGAAKNKFQYLKNIVGIAVDAPKFFASSGEDFILMNCEDWSEDTKAYYTEQNKTWRFFETENIELGTTTNKYFPSKPGRNDPCFCGSGRKFKRCHGMSQKT